MSAFGGMCQWDGQPLLVEQLSELAANLQPAGPDANGQIQPAPWLALQAYLLHFDRLSRREQQPHVFGPGLVLTWDGRLDNRDDLRLILQHDLGDDDSDAAVVAAAWQRWGLDVLPRLVGDWALAIWDAPEERLILARDYMGNRPLYYRAAGKRLAWATRLEALAAAERLFTQPDDGYIAAYLAGEPPVDMTVFAGVLRLVPGHYVIANSCGLMRRRYWKYTPAAIRYRRADQYGDHLRALLDEAVQVRLRASRPVWAHLSGGWDSSSVVCLAHRLIVQRRVESSRLQPLSIVHSDPEAEPEREFMAAVERWCGLSTMEFPRLGPPPFSDRLGSRIPMPTDDISRIHRTIQAAGDHVVLTGSLGDLFALSVAPMPALWEAVRDRRSRDYFSRLLEWARAEKIAVPTLLARVMRNDYHARSPNTSPYKPDSYSASPRLLRSLRAREPVARPSSSEFPKATRELVDMLYCKADRGTMAVDELGAPVIVTHPYSHRPLVDYLLAIPRSVMFSPDFQRAGMRQALLGILPREISERRSKVGIPFLSYRRLMFHVMERVKRNPPLTDPATEWRLVQRGIVESTTIATLVRQTSSTARPSDFLERCLIIEAWLRTLSGSCDHVDQRARPGMAVV